MNPNNDSERGILTSDEDDEIPAANATVEEDLYVIDSPDLESCPAL